MTLDGPVSDGLSRRKWPSFVLLAILSYALGFAAYWHFLYIFNPRMELLYGYQRELLNGHVEWVADQNRVLAPILILALQKLFGLEYQSAYQHFMFTIFVVQNFCAALLFRRCGLSTGQVVVGLLLVSAIPLFFMNLWWFPWTNLEFTLVLLTFLVDAGRVRPALRVVLYGCVFIAWMLTKETCFVFPVWIGLRYGLPALRERRWGELARLVALCAALVAVSAGVITGLRHWLWVSGSNPDYPTGMPGDTPTLLAGTHLFSLNPVNVKHMIRNYRAFFTLHMPWPLWDNGHFIDWSVGMIEMLVALAITTGGTIWTFAHRPSRVRALTLTGLVYVVVLFVFVNPLEADKLMPLLAIGAYGYALVAGSRENPETSTLPTVDCARNSMLQVSSR